METVTTLDDKVRAFKVLLDKKDELTEQTKANNEEIKNLEQEIAQQMVDEEKPDTTVDGFKYSLQEKTRYSKISEEKLMEKGLVFFDVLREQGFGHLITERVDPRTLDSAMNNLAGGTMANCRKKWQRCSPFIRNLRYPREKPTPRL